MTKFTVYTLGHSEVNTYMVVECDDKGTPIKDAVYSSIARFPISLRYPDHEQRKRAYEYRDYLNSIHREMPSISNHAKTIRHLQGTMGTD